jgi:2-keto-4-pentenoate hydratase/2-oxohepta-3-ene-1,7-dioic acid hydratase in catechol pathway
MPRRPGGSLFNRTGSAYAWEEETGRPTVSPESSAESQDHPGVECRNRNWNVDRHGCSPSRSGSDGPQEKGNPVRLGTLQTADGPKVVGVSLDGQCVDLCAIDAELPTTLIEILQTPDGLFDAAAALAQGLTKGPFVTGTWLPPIPHPGKVLCIGLNYRDHAIETGAAIPTEPIVFSKFSQAVVGPEVPIMVPAVSQEVDYEAELVVVIGKTGKRIPQAKAWEHVAGYTAGNDVSARDWQKGRPGGQWLLGKTPDSFAPCGPYLVTHDEVGDPHQLRVSLRLNGETMQNSTTKELIFGIDALIAHVSQLVTLHPGDLIFTGTPPGVGAARKPPVFLKPGDVVEVDIEYVGVLRNPVIAETVA